MIPETSERKLHREWQVHSHHIAPYIAATTSHRHDDRGAVQLEFPGQWRRILREALRLAEAEETVRKAEAR